MINFFEKALNLYCLNQAIFSSFEKGKKGFVGEIRTWGGRQVVKHEDGWVYLDQTGKGKHLFWKDGQNKTSQAEEHHVKHATEHLHEHNSKLQIHERYPVGSRVTFTSDDGKKEMVGKVIAHSDPSRGKSVHVRGEDGVIRKLNPDFKSLKPNFSTRNLDKTVLKNAKGENAVAKTSTGKPISPYEDFDSMDSSELREAHKELVEHQSRLLDVNSDTNDTSEAIKKVRDKLARGLLTDDGLFPMYHLGPNNQGHDEYTIIHGKTGKSKTTIKVVPRISYRGPHPYTSYDITFPKNNPFFPKEIADISKRINKHSENIVKEDNIKIKEVNTLR